MYTFSETVMTKIALNAVKARALAESVGIIPHHKSNWKWALRQLRAKNPTGAYQTADDLMLKGKDLAKSKEKMGLLPNNVRQKIKALARKQRQGVEVGAAGGSPNSMEYVVGEVGSVKLPERHAWDIKRKPYYNIHTHPIVPITYTRPQSRLKTIKKNLSTDASLNPYIIDEIRRSGDPALRASPSGMPWGVQENIPHVKKITKIREGLNAEFSQASRPIRLKANSLIGRIDPNLPTEVFGNRINRIVDARNSMYNKLDAKNPLSVKLDARLDVPEFSGGDFYHLKNHIRTPNNVPPTSNIMASQATSINKYRPKLPNMTRSVYFNGGTQ